MLENIDGEPPLVGADGDLGVPIINIKKYQWWAAWWVLTEFWERPPSTLENVDGGPLAGANGDPRASTINVKKCRGLAPWRVLQEIRERLPSTCKNVDGGPQAPMGVQSPSRI
jgi:hypothetical protein